MNATVIVAIIALVGAVLSAAISLYGQHWSSAKAARRDAESVLAKYREPLVDAAYELQSRLYNIVELGFLRKYYLDGDEAQKRYAVQNTLYVVAQYFGWSEILRREIQLLSFFDTKRARVVAERQRRVVESFQSDDESLGRPFLIWRGEQRGIGELMIQPDDVQAQCMGYASFLENQTPSLRLWLSRLESDIGEIAQSPNPRLVRLQHSLVDLIRDLDPKRVRYSDEELQKV